MKKKSITSTEIGSTSAFVGEEKAVELVAKAGFDAWDFSMCSNILQYNWGEKTAKLLDHPLAGSNYLAYAKKLKQIGEDNGIFCNQSHAPFPVSCKTIRDELKRSLELSAEVGAKICVVHPDNWSSATENAEIYFELLPFAKSLGVKIATENMWNWNYEKDYAAAAACSHHDDFLAHVNAVNDDYLVACVDIGHAEMKGLETTAVQMIKTLGKHVQAVHIHDNDRWHDSHQLPYTMQIDFAPIIKALKEIDYKGDITMECDGFISNSKNVAQALKELANTARKIADEFDAL